MMIEENPRSECRLLERAGAIEAKRGIPKSVLYEMAKRRRIPFYAAGPKGTGARFIGEEVLEALRRPVWWWAVVKGRLGAMG